MIEGMFIVACFMFIISLVCTAFVWSEVRAMKQSTHRVQIYDPFKNDFEPITQKEKEILTKSTEDLMQNVM